MDTLFWKTGESIGHKIKQISQDHPCEESKARPHSE